MTEDSCAQCGRADVPLLAYQRIHYPDHDGGTGYYYDELVCVDCITKENGEDGSKPEDDSDRP